MDVSRETECIGCGACEGICSTGAIKVLEIGRRGHMPFVDKINCIHCGLCYKICPIQEISIPEDFSKVQAVYRAKSNRSDVFLKGSSGGGVSSLLISLFNQQLIDAALVVFYDKELNLYGDFITCATDVLKHAGSFYQPSKQLINISKIRGFHSIAVVGLPCHIEAIKKFTELFKIKNIYVKISLFCTIGRMKNGLKDYIKQNFEVDFDCLEFVDYKSRGGQSRFSKGDIVLKTKNKKTLVYSYTNYIGFVGFFYTPNGCFNCRKIFELNADISIGDYNRKKEADKKFCLLSINSERGHEVFSKCDLLDFEKLENPVQALLNSQPRGTPFKVYNSALKIPIVKLVKFIGRFNQIPVINRVVYYLKDALISILIRISSNIGQGPV